MAESHKKLAEILKTDPLKLEQLDDKMSTFSGRTGAFRAVLAEGEGLVNGTLERFNLPTDQRTSVAVYQLLLQRLSELDAVLYQYLDRPSLLNAASCTKLIATALELAQPPNGFFIKPSKAAEMLERNPPPALLEHFGESNIANLIAREGLATVLGALRFIQPQAWMHQWFAEAYSDLIASDFEERPAEIKIIDPRWLPVASQFVEHKFHNVSHLKEWGVIFVLPLEIDTPGEMLRVFSLLLHYLNEVPFYSALFRRFANRPDFANWVSSLLRGDVVDLQTLQNNQIAFDWLIVQRYLFKEDPSDARLSIPHVNPETIHWHQAMENFQRLKPLIGATGEYFDIWHNLDWVGGKFPLALGSVESSLVSFNMMDLVMSLVAGSSAPVLYHQPEALWNKLFMAHFGREKLAELISEHIIEGYIKF